MNKIINKENVKINTKAFGINDQIFFTQRLSLLLDSDISIIESLLIMKNMDKSKDRKVIYDALVKNIEHGVSLGKSIKALNLRLNSLLITLIQNGEEIGNLSQSLLQCYGYLEKKKEIRNKIVSALIYPIFIVIATVVMTLFLILYIFPKIIPLLSSLDIKLPFITRMVQALYLFMASYGFWVSISCILFVILFKVVVNKNKKLSYMIDSLLLKLPFAKVYSISSVCSVGEMFLSSGRSLTDMIIFSRDSTRNVVYKKIFGEISLDITRGASLSNSIRRYKSFFPPLLLDMCMIGEKTDNLGVMLGHCSRIFEQDIDNSLKQFSSLIEPTLMIFMGIVVGTVALSIILPVYEITNHLSR